MEEMEKLRQGDCERNGSGDQLVDPREKAELQEVNNVLSKAVKARKKMAFKMGANAACKTDNEDTRIGTQEQEYSTPVNQLWEISDMAARSEPSRLITTTAENADVKHVNGVMVRNVGDEKIDADHMVVQGIHEDQAIMQGAVQSWNVNSKGSTTGPKTASKENSSTEVNRSASSNSIHSFQISNSRPKSGRGRVTPAHITAPFKTHPNLPVPKRQRKKSEGSIILQDRKKKYSITLTRNRGQSKVLPPIHADSKFNSLETNLTDIPTGASIEKDCSEPSVHVVENGLYEERGLSEGMIEETPTGLSALTLNDKAETNKTGVPDKRDMVNLDGKCPHVDSFSLQAHGSNINIPSKVRRVFAKNQQLRHKLQQRNLQKTSCVHRTKMGEMFIQKLERMFDCEAELLYRQRAWHCLQAHNRLGAAMGKINLHQLTDLCSPEEVLRAKLLVEFVLSSFSALSEEADLLSKIQFTASSDASVEAFETKSDQPHHVWLPSDHHEPASVCSTSKLNYTSSQQLQQFVNLLLTVQALRCQLQLTQLTSSILPALEDGNLQRHDVPVSALRGIFALATSSGEHCPALIHSD